MVSCAGLNLQKACRTMIEFEPPPNESTRAQALSRFKRGGQPAPWVRHISLLTADSYNTQQEAQSILKGLPFLLTQLNREVWGVGDDNDEDDEQELGDHVLFNNELYPVDHERVAGLDLEVLDPDTLLLHIQQKLLGRELKGDIDSVRKLAHSKQKYEAVANLDPLWT